MVTARRWLITALESADTGHEWVYAAPARVAALFERNAHPRLRSSTRRAMDPARPGYRRRDAAGDLVLEHEVYTPRLGMSARTLAEHQAEFLEYASTTSSRNGRYRLHRDKRFYALPYEVAWTLAYHATNPELRCALAHLGPLAMAVSQQRTNVKAPVRRGRARTGQGMRRFCSAMRGLRLLGLITDTRPERHYRPRARRYPTKRIIVALSPLAPLAKGRIRWRRPAGAQPAQAGLGGRSDEVRYAIRGAEPSGLLASGERATPHAEEVGEELAPIQGPPASPAAPEQELDRVSDGARPEPIETSAAEPRGEATVTDQGPRLTLTTTREILASRGIQTRDRMTLAVLTATLCTRPDLERVLELEREQLEAVAHPARWLAAIARADGPAMRSPNWAGSFKRQSAEQRTPGRKLGVCELVSESEKRRKAALQRAIRETDGDPRRIETVAAAYAEAGDADSADALREWARAEVSAAEWREAHARGKRISAAWQAWRTAVAAVATGIDEDAASHTIGVVIAHDEHTASVLAEDETSARQCLDWGTARRLADELARVTQCARVLRFVRPDGSLIGEAHPKAPHEYLRNAPRPAQPHAEHAAEPANVRRCDPLGRDATEHRPTSARRDAIAALERLAASSPSARRLLAGKKSMA